MTQTFQQYAHEFSEPQNRLITGLLEKGFTFNHYIKRNEESIVLLVSCDDVVTVVAPSGEVELITENIDPYEQNDTGNHVWTLWPSDADSEADFLISTITRIAGTD